MLYKYHNDISASLDVGSVYCGINIYSKNDHRNNYFRENRAKNNLITY